MILVHQIQEMILVVLVVAIPVVVVPQEIGSNWIKKQLIRNL